MGAAIQTFQIRKSFRDIKALDSIDVTVEKGKVTALLGPNGAGKTTLVRILTTLLRPDGGHAFVLSHDVSLFPNTVRSKIGLSGQFAAIDEHLTGQENLELVGRLYHLSKKESQKRASGLLERFGLLDAADRVAKHYSGGMRRRLDLAASLIANPPLLFLDEPTTGLDLPSRLELWKIIKQLVSGGTTLLLTTQYLEEADYLADFIVVMDHGRIIAEGTPQTLKSRIAYHVLEVHVEDKNMLEKAAEAISKLDKGKPHVDRIMNKITLPVKDGASLLAEAVRHLDNANVNIANLAIHQPTLDDVFLSLTGHMA